jgi:hypothetical protein
LLLHSFFFSCRASFFLYSSMQPSFLFIFCSSPYEGNTVVEFMVGTVAVRSGGRGQGGSGGVDFSGGSSSGQQHFGEHGLWTVSATEKVELHGFWADLVSTA